MTSLGSLGGALMRGEATVASRSLFLNVNQIKKHLHLYSSLTIGIPRLTESAGRHADYYLGKIKIRK